MDTFMPGFSQRDITVDGVRVAVLEAGSGEPLVYFHGAGAGRGFDELLPLARQRRVIVPIHPGFGASDDDPGITAILDYVVHYGALFDELGLTAPVDIIGHSLGGWIASLFAIFSGHRVRKLALVCPAGLRVPEHPGADLFMIPPEALPSRLVASPEMLAALTQGPVTNEMRIARYREMTSLARLIWDRACEPKLDHWLKRVTAPTLLLWGREDRVLPAAQAEHWARRLGATPEIATFDGVGHLVLMETPRAVERIERFLDT